LKVSSDLSRRELAMDKFGHEPLHYPDEVQPDKHKRDRDPEDAKPRRRHGATTDDAEGSESDDP
jgi:hypothetical protein